MMKVSGIAWLIYRGGGILIKSPESLIDCDVDEIVLGTLMGLDEVQEQLKELKLHHIPLNKEYVTISVMSRRLFLKRLAETYKKKNLQGAVAEAGVFRGEFAKIINETFPDSTCYLFDTFEGFAEEDYAYETEESMIDAEHLRMTSEELVYNKMPYKDKVIIKKGYFPATAEGITDNFIFVNLDMDLYHPILEGLRFFFPLMKEGGVILIHDYFTEVFPNVEKAVDDYEREAGIKLNKLPIGDDISLAIIK